MEKFFSVLLSKHNYELFSDNGYRILTFGCAFFAFVSLVLTAFNIYKGYWFMAATTFALVLGFVVASFLSHRGNISISRYITAIICGVVFTYYALSGQNDGFAILWISLIPVISYFLVGLRIGFVLCLYFQIFLVVLFYTPLSAIVASYYTTTFLGRFPLLYLASFGSTTILAYQLQVMNNTIHKKALYDDMTGLYNRRSYNDERAVLLAAKSPVILNVITFDLNRLKYVNDNIGHEAGDAMIVKAAQFIADSFEGDTCYRTGGDEFVAISRRSKDQVMKSGDRLRNALDAQDKTREDTVSISFGIAYGKDHPSADFGELSRLSEQEMYADKALFYDSEGLDRRC